FKKVVLDWGKNFPAAFTVQSSDNGRLWSNVYSVNKSTGGGNEENEVLFEPTTKRFIRILINQNTDFSLRELQVYN
ncbi:MAG: discoidin domain-containing protein, partial [Spirochaetia bacterium]